MKEAPRDTSRYVIHFSVYNKDTVKHSQMRDGGAEVELNLAIQNVPSQAPDLNRKRLGNLRTLDKTSASRRIMSIIYEGLSIFAI